MVNTPHPRYAFKFTDASGGNEIEFPLNVYEYTPEMNLQRDLMQVNGIQYAYNPMGFRASKKQPARESVRFLFGEESVENLSYRIDQFRAACLNNGLGKIWTRGWEEGVETERWAWAFADQMPRYTVTTLTIEVLPMSIQFMRIDDWMSPDLVTETLTFSATGTLNNLAVLGNIDVDAQTIILKPNVNAGFSNPVITNLTTGYVLQSLRDSAATANRLRLQTEIGGPNGIQWSADGVTFSSDWANYVIQSKQLPTTFKTKAGDNSIRYDGAGTVNLDVIFQYTPRWA